MVPRGTTRQLQVSDREEEIERTGAALVALNSEHDAVKAGVNEITADMSQLRGETVRLPPELQISTSARTRKTHTEADKLIWDLGDYQARMHQELVSVVAEIEHLARDNFGVRQRLCPVCSTAFAAETVPLPCVFHLPSRLRQCLLLRCLRSSSR